MLRAIKTTDGRHVVVNVNNVTKVEPASDNKVWNLFVTGDSTPISIGIEELCNFIDKLRNINPYDVYTYDILKGYKNKP